MKKITRLDIYRGALFASSVFIVGFLWENPVLVFVLLAALFIEVNRILNWQFLKTGLVCMVLGPTAEIIAIAFKSWSYANYQFAGIPIWLPVLWGLATTFFISLALFIGDIPVTEAGKKG